MAKISNKPSKNAKALCEQMAGQCQIARLPKSAIENFNRKPYYMENDKRVVVEPE